MYVNVRNCYVSHIYNLKSIPAPLTTRQKRMSRLPNIWRRKHMPPSWKKSNSFLASVYYTIQQYQGTSVDLAVWSVDQTMIPRLFPFGRVSIVQIHVDAL